MISPRATRRRAYVLISLVWGLVCGGLGWATRSAIRLEEVENLATRRSADERARALAISRLDAIVEPVLARERVRPYEHFRKMFVLAKPLDAQDYTPVERPIAQQSPLATLGGPEWLLLHFQVSENQGWTSPQLESAAAGAVSARMFAPLERARLARPENWLAALQERYTPTALQGLLEQALAADMEIRQAIIHRRSGDHSGETALSASNEPDTSDRADAFARRGARLIQLQREVFPLDRCEPETIALTNLDASSGASAHSVEGQPACVQVVAGMMLPVWLDLTGDSEPQLAFVRSAHAETSQFCTLQGVLIDWPRLRDTLETEIQDLFPDARIVPMQGRITLAEASSTAMMQTIPARLDVGSSMPVAAAVSSGLWGGLGLAWATTLLALAAITYGTLKYVSMSERRMQFVSAVTHELRTPLTSFQIYSDLLADAPNETAERRTEYAEVLRDESRRLARLVDNVLAYSRIGDARPKLSLKETPLSDLLSEAARTTREVCEQSNKKLVIENRCGPDASLWTDPEFVLQILVNLIENACKYSRNAHEASIWLSAVPSEGEVSLEVEDAGSGVALGDRRAIFQPFRRGHKNGEHEVSGVGLGLAMSRHWATCLGGRLGLKRGSRNGSSFSCFSLTLPAERPA